MDDHSALDVARSAFLRSCALEAYGALVTAQVDVRVLKGLALESLLYGPDEPRRYVDLDLLIPPADWHRAPTVLRRLGYVRLDQGDVAHRQIHSVVFRRDGGRGPGVEIDLHHRLPGTRVTSRRVWATASRDPVWIPAGTGSGVLTVNLPTTLFLLATSSLPGSGGTGRHIEEYRRLLTLHPGLEQAGRAVARELGATALFERALGFMAGHSAEPPAARIKNVGANLLVAHLRRAPTLRARAELAWDLLRRSRQAP